MNALNVKKTKLRKYRALHLMVLPALISYFLLKYIPTLGFSMAFVDYKLGKPILECNFVGLKYFEKFFADISTAKNVFFNTIFINIMSIVGMYLIGVIISIAFQECKWKKISRISQMTAMFPYFMSAVVVYSIALIFFGQNNGVINQGLTSLGIVNQGINFLGGEKWSRWTMIFCNIWIQAGYYSIMFYSTLTSINDDEYDAASIDGASRWQRIRYITLPHLSSTIWVLGIVSAGQIMTASFDTFMLWTNAQNYDSMITLGVYAYKYGLGKGQFSYATAVDIFNTIVSLAIVMIANYIAKKRANTSLV